ncbi:tetratricopeptide repeat protein [Murinocardiopsis flavida]|uniref:Tetratricopeptide repeat protein n=1 Tax=Murinocardiopsis flavida TaxID=645275 RepID=A0A2P8CUV3_9ACTN|nr:tetratricopeptide repeat protein [Murinocardiopsis flavida]PSK88740.1 tetratricopeptide repeat protein [Murinocardiopsis flavida]
MTNLGFLLKGQGERGEAEALYRRAIAEGGNTRAMVNLAFLLEGRGKYIEAVKWRLRAAKAAWGGGRDRQD